MPRLLLLGVVLLLGVAAHPAPPGARRPAKALSTERRRRSFHLVPRLHRRRGTGPGRAGPRRRRFRLTLVEAWDDKEGPPPPPPPPPERQVRWWAGEEL